MLTTIQLITVLTCMISAGTLLGIAYYFFENKSKKTHFYITDFSNNKTAFKIDKTV